MRVKPDDKPWLAHYDMGVPQTVAVQNVTLQSFLESAATTYGDKTAVAFKGFKLTYRELNNQANAVAAALWAHGFKQGERAAIYMPNSPQFVIAYYGILKAGGVVVATNPLYTERELLYQLADCAAETIFVMSLFYEKIKAVQAEGQTKLKRVIVSNFKEYFPSHLRMLFTVTKERKEGHLVRLRRGDIYFQDFLALGEYSPTPTVQVTGDDVAVLQYSGGTTGISKGAIGLHRQLATNTAMIEAWLTDVQPAEEVILGAIPLFQSYGMVAVLNLAMRLAGTLILIVNPRDQQEILGSIIKYRPTIFPGVPAMYVAINHHPDVLAGKYDLSSIRACISGSAPLQVETKRQFEELTGGKLVEGFGLTEAHAATHANPLRGVNKAGSIGLPLPGVECRIVDQETGRQDLRAGETGELLIKSPTVMTDYWNNDQETAAVLKDGWLYTGDIVEMDEDGYFYIRGRKKEMIIAGGYSIYPREVEVVLAQHPAVLEAAVVGVPDPQRGETVKAWIVKKAGFEAVTAEEIIEWSKSELAKYKYPRLVEFIDELPKSAAFMVLKRELLKREVQTQQQRPDEVVSSFE